MSWRDILSWLADLVRRSQPSPPATPSPPPDPPPATPGPPDPSQQMIGHLVELHSGVRESSGLTRLIPNDQLTRMAVEYARRMAEAGRMTHNLGPGLDFSSRLRGSGYPAVAAGENIAAGQRDAPQVFGAWMRSDGHRSNIMNPAYRECGMGTAVSRTGVRYWCVVLASRRRMSVAASLDEISVPETLWFEAGGSNS